MRACAAHSPCRWVCASSAGWFCLAAWMPVPLLPMTVQMDDKRFSRGIIIIIQFFIITFRETNANGIDSPHLCHWAEMHAHTRIAHTSHHLPYESHFLIDTWVSPFIKPTWFLCASCAQIMHFFGWFTCVKISFLQRVVSRAPLKRVDWCNLHAKKWKLE